VEKRRFIKDPLWGNLEIFLWESQLLSQFLVNRLHHVLQTSCAYLVYPGLRHSRLLHSLGVMHVATQMFVNLVANTAKPLPDEFSNEAQLVETFFPDDKQKNSIIAAITERINCPSQYALLLGTIRVSALLHDLGHLPYSHIFEFALDRFIHNSFSENMELLGYELPDEQQQIVRRFHVGLNDIFGSGASIHERLGQSLLKTLLHPYRSNPFQEEFSFAPFVNGAIQLWVGQRLPISKSLLYADIDADRIDFVNRDSSFSGLFQSAVDFGRLFSFYELAKTEDKDNNIVLRARPSLRASAEAEKLLWERFLDYKYIMSHHKVHLFDEILERLLYFCISEGSMNAILEPIITLAREPISQVISDRKRVLEAENGVLSSFNDSWVDVQLRKSYEETVKKQDEIATASLRKTLYEGLSEQRNLFKPVFKRDEDYYEKLGFTATAGISLRISLAIKEHKYRWERALSDRLGTSVIVGDLSKKLRVGLADTRTTEFFGLTSLREFLESKYHSSRQLNVWYYTPLGDRQTGNEQEIIDFLKTQLSDIL